MLDDLDMADVEARVVEDFERVRTAVFSAAREKCSAG
jgi:hypothetical protein